MLTCARSSVRLVLFAALIVFAITTAPRAADAALGDTLRSITVNLPCTTSTSVVTVAGHRVGLPNFPALLAVSCLTGTLTDAAAIHYVDPGEEVANRIVQTIPTKLNGLAFPPFGWSALAYRPDVGDFIGCATLSNFESESSTVGIYAIDVNAVNTVTDGTVSTLLERPGNTGFTCDGLAWDSSDKSIYTGFDQQSTIYQLKNINGVWQEVRNFPVPTIPVGEGSVQCPRGGLALVGGTLAVGCADDNRVALLDKTASTPGLVSSFTTDDTSVRFEDVECDPATFASQNKDALWVNRGFGGASILGDVIITPTTFPTELAALEVPGGSCGLVSGPPVLAPAACPDDPETEVDESTLDTDGDGLLDCWEDRLAWTDNLPGIDYDGDGVRDITLCITGVNGTQECASKYVKDVFIEFDSMVNQPANLPALRKVVTAFLNAPVQNAVLPPNVVEPGYIATGVRLHVQVDEQNVPAAINTAMPPCTPPAATGDANFDSLKTNHFGTVAERGTVTPPTAPGASPYDAAQREKTLYAKRMAFRWGISVRNLTRATGTSSPSGCAEVPGNDFIVALGSFGAGNGTQDQWEGTFMHEVGHLLGLHHGGGDRFNCKPNYLSVMNYAFQFSNPVTDRRLDYSDRVLAPLSEVTALNEPGPALGLDALTLPLSAKNTAPRTAYGPGTAKLGAAAGGLRFNTDADTLDLNVSANVNRIASGTGCADGAGGGLAFANNADVQEQSPTPLVGYDDWANLVFNFRKSFDFADGVHESTDPALNREITAEETQALANAADADADGVADIMACGAASCAIDAVPGLANNPVIRIKEGAGSKAIVPVAILSKTNFDATKAVLRPTLTLNATPVLKILGKPACIMVDVNHDHKKDLVCTFVLTDVSLGHDTVTLEAEAILNGKTTTFRAQDFINVTTLSGLLHDDD